MDGVDWIGAVVAAVAGGGGVLYFAMKDLSPDDQDNRNDGTDGRGD